MRLLERATQPSANAGNSGQGMPVVSCLTPVEAARACAQAQVARYGAVSEGLMGRIAALAARRSRQFIL